MYDINSKSLITSKCCPIYIDDASHKYNNFVVFFFTCSGNRNVKPIIQMRLHFNACNVTDSHNCYCFFVVFTSTNVLVNISLKLSSPLFLQNKTKNILSHKIAFQFIYFKFYYVLETFGEIIIMIVIVIG